LSIIIIAYISFVQHNFWGRQSQKRNQLPYLKKMMYGQKNEKTEVIMKNGMQLSVFHGAEQEAEVSPKAARTTIEVGSQSTQETYP